MAAATFRVPTSSGRRSPRWVAVGGYFVGWAVLAGLCIARQRGTPALDSIWAEDGRVFLHDAINGPFTRVFFRPFGGYMHGFDRVVAEIVSRLPIRDAAAGMSGVAASSVALLGLVVYRASAGFLRSGMLRALLVLAMVALPAAQFEVLNNVANVHYFFMFAAFWCLLWVPSGVAGEVVAIAVVSVAGLSDPNTLLLAPVVALRLLGVRGLRRQLMTIAFGVSLIIQFVVCAQTSLGFGERAPVWQLVRLYPLRVVVPGLIGVSGADALWRSIGWGAAFVGLVMLVGLVGVALARSPRPVFVGVVALTAVAYWLVPVYLRWAPGWSPTGRHIGLYGSRYTVIPMLMVLTMVLVVFDRAPSAWRHVPPDRAGGRASEPLVWVASRAAIIVAVLAVLIVDYPSENLRNHGPRWSEAVKIARAECVAGTASRTVAVPTTPPGWSVEIPCSRLT